MAIWVPIVKKMVPHSQAHPQVMYQNGGRRMKFLVTIYATIEADSQGDLMDILEKIVESVGGDFDEVSDAWYGDYEEEGTE